MVPGLDRRAASDLVKRIAVGQILREAAVALVDPALPEGRLAEHRAPVDGEGGHNTLFVRMLGLAS